MKPLSTPFTTFTDRMRGRGNKALYIEYAITICCGLGSMLFGYDQGVFGGLLDSTSFMARFPSISNGNSTLQGFTVAVYEIGCAIGALSVVLWGDRYGRRATVVYGMIVLAIGAVLQFLSYGLPQMIVGRIVTGIGNGLTTSVLPMWNGECARDHSRGRAVMWQLNINIFGIALAYWVDYGLNQSSATMDTEWSWRFPLALQVVFAAGTILLVCFLPESPRFLVMKNRLAEARDVMDMLSTIEDAQQRKAVVDEKMFAIEHALDEESVAVTRSWTQCFTQGKPRYFQRMVLAIVALCMLQLSGINLITYYAPVIFQDTIGMSRNTSLLVTGFNGLAYWLCTFIPLPLIDRLGRRPLMLFAAVGQTITMAILAAMIADGSSKAKGYVAAALLFVFNGFFAVGFCGIPFLLPMELTPLATRAKSVAIATACFWSCNFFVVMISPVLIARIKWGTYVLWTGTNLAFIPLIYFFIPETLNAALEDIDTLFETSSTWIMGPGSRRRLAKIVASREAAQAMHVEMAQSGGKDAEDVQAEQAGNRA
ncbi:hypothetical protein JCM24511_00030 [Saitozyma sp. JCM 24511]|nr:hypothetical protein JCM24511_00030 [Saitozyma sp. JCM 24511]